MKRPHKYRAQPTVVDGVRFASKREARRYGELKLLEQAGEIHDLRLQPRFPLMAPGLGNGGPYERVHLGEYRGDFLYCACRRGAAKCERTRTVVEDVKGFKTPLYRWKKRHVEAQYGIQIREV
jgi:hypothetical protein